MTHETTLKFVGVFCIIKLILELSRWRSWVGFLFYILIPAQPNIESIDNPFLIIFFSTLSPGSSTSKEVATTKIQ